MYKLLQLAQAMQIDLVQVREQKRQARARRTAGAAAFRVPLHPPTRTLRTLMAAEAGEEIPRWTHLAKFIAPEPPVPDGVRRSKRTCVAETNAKMYYGVHAKYAVMDF